MRTIFWHPTGPLLRYGAGTIEIEDLNPQIATRWVVGRATAARIGLKLLWAALVS